MDGGLSDSLVCCAWVLTKAEVNSPLFSKRILTESDTEITGDSLDSKEFGQLSGHG